jgi:hypothetical protein
MKLLVSWQNARVLLISEKQDFAFMPVHSRTVLLSKIFLFFDKSIIKKINFFYYIKIFL